MTFFDHSGVPVAYLHEAEYVYLLDGRPVAMLREEYLYAYSGKYLGWLHNGWVWDRAGQAVFFTENSSGGPVRPARQFRSAKDSRGAPPVLGVREVPPARPVQSLTWSPLSGPQFFDL
jgi:hypothetical protein